MAEKNKVEVRIAGKDYTLVGTESDEYIQKIGLYIDKKMAEILKRNSKLSTSMAAVLTALNVADDFFKAHESETGLRNDVKRLTDELQKLREEKRLISEQNSILAEDNTNLKLELAKREAELKEVRSLLEKSTGAKI